MLAIETLNEFGIPMEDCMKVLDAQDLLSGDHERVVNEWIEKVNQAAKE